MSANFILEYAGQPVCFFESGATNLVPEHQASFFCSEADAWYAAYRAGLNPMHCRVVNLYTRGQKEARP